MTPERTIRTGRPALAALLLTLALGGCNLQEIRDEAERRLDEFRDQAKASVWSSGDSAGGAFNEMLASVSNSLVESVLATFSQSDARSNLKTYSREATWSAQSALVAGIAVAAANCKINSNRGKSCGRNAAVAVPVGMAIGAAGGWLLASRQNRFENEGQALQAELNAAQRELAEAKSAGLAARRLVDERTEELASLRAQRQEGKSVEAALNRSLEEAKADEYTLRLAIGRLRDENKLLAEANAQRNGSSADAAKLKALHADLVEERSDMDQQLSLLLNAMDLQA